MDELCDRFGIERPPELPDDHWVCVEREGQRLKRSLEADDAWQALSDLKCMVESIARIVLEIEGTPATPNASFDGIVKRAHELLARQPGHELAYDTPFGNIATQSNKIVLNLATIRNTYGGGHGRARTPILKDEMVTLAFDGALLWSRWALRRLGYFSLGRPNALVEDLVVRNKTFHSGKLKERLMAANLPDAAEDHQRSIGVAVGRRAMQGTFVVRRDGLDPCLESDDLNTWPRDYRLGLAYGLWFDRGDRITITAGSVRWALGVLEPVSDCGDELKEWVDAIVRIRNSGGVSDDWQESRAVADFVKSQLRVRPEQEKFALQRLADNITPEPLF
ncbi:abortive infection family protein [Haloechinothrix sp. YIM 98757]|uniref:Abortive infection family protein n=1 Tax=Haloechinothrix aidingensis TaxID=2752311 RepID=A0A838ADL9_9PSEU|nr:abortive infection family protein [Haloechinothrix aidingensis]MBA0127301.1 abortive infection family protein [Haloechinothrix aidingensis]